MKARKNTKQNPARKEKDEFPRVETKKIYLNNFSAGILFISLLSLSFLVLFFYLQKPIVQEKTIQEQWKEQWDAAEDWRRSMIEKWYKGVTNEELDSATRWLEHAKPFDIRKSCSQQSNQLNDTTKQLLTRKINEFKNNLPKMSNDTVTQKILVHSSFHSNAIEGNTLTLEETTIIIAGKRLSPSPALPDEYLSVSAGKDIQETKNHAQALQYLGLTIPGTPSPIVISEYIPWQIILKDINSYILKDMSIHGKNDLGGEWRPFPVAIGVEKVLLPQPDEIPKLMEMFEMWLNQRLKDIQNDKDVIELACDAHLKFVNIHPFSDGNGRTARLLDGLILNKFGLPLPIFDSKYRQQYMTKVSKALQPENWEMKPMCDLHAHAFLTTIDLLNEEKPN